jgi:hypothetical protein
VGPFALRAVRRQERARVPVLCSGLERLPRYVLCASRFARPPTHRRADVALADNFLMNPADWGRSADFARAGACFADSIACTSAFQRVSVRVCGTERLITGPLDRLLEQSRELYYARGQSIIANSTHSMDAYFGCSFLAFVVAFALLGCVVIISLCLLDDG